MPTLRLPVSFPYTGAAGIIHSLAVDPSRGDIYYVDEVGGFYGQPTQFGLYRNGQLITTNVSPAWSLRFADAKWAGY